jgi:hypothetical protein
MAKTIKGVVLKHVIGVFMAIAIFFLLMIFVDRTNSSFLFGVGDFILSNFMLLLVIIILHFLADLFETFSFPVNLPFPLFKAFAVTAGVIFMFNFFEALISVYSLVLALSLTSYGVYIYRLVFIIVLFISLFGLFKRKQKEKIVEKTVVKEVVEEVPSEKKKESPEESEPLEDDISWKQIVKEFKGFLYGVVKKLRDSVNKDEIKKKTEHDNPSEKHKSKSHKKKNN